MVRSLFVMLVAGAFACGGGGGGGDDTGDGDGGSGDDDGGGGGPDAGPALDYCMLSCDVPGDCATGGAGTIIDANNYACDAGRCVWLGCLSTAECTTTYGDPGYLCEAAFGATVPTCWPTCGAPADCTADSPILDADNYACDGGKCRWTGCNSTTECTSAYQSPDWRCEARGGADLATCWPTCATATDCATASPAYDADNYACDDGVCEYTGCNSTAECTAIGPDYVCD